MNRAMFCPAGFARLSAPFGNELWIAWRAIVCLFFSRSPAAVAWFIIAIVIDTVKAKIWRWFAHVGVKILEVIYPAFADGNSSAAVPNVSRIIRVQTAIFHPFPGTIRARLFSVDYMPVGFCNSLSVMTTIGDAFPFQIAKIRGGRLAAITLTKPMRLVVSVSMRKVQSNERSKASSCDIEEGRHV
jgi:hypothetical protein